MSRAPWMNAAAVLLAATAVPAALAAPVPAEKSPLSWVPASTPVVFHINGLHNLRDHLVAFLRNAGERANANLVQDFTEGGFRNGFDGHKIRGVPKNGHILVAMMDLNHLDGDAPDLAVMAAVEDYKTFRDNLLNEDEKKTLASEDGYESAVLDVLWPGKTCFLVDKKDHVIFTPRKERAIAFAKGDAPGLDGRISKAQSDRLLHSDLGVYVGMDIFHKEYADMVKGARDVLDRELKRADELPDRTMKPLIAPAREALGPLFQAVDDSQGVLVTVNFGADGLAVHAESELRPGSATAASLKDFKPEAFPGLEKMPAGQIEYVGMETPPPLFRLTGTMLFSSVIDPKGDEAKAVDAAIQDMLKAGPHDRLLAVTVPPAGIEAWQFDDPERAVAAQAKLIEATGAGLVQAGVLKAKPEITPHAQKYKGFDFTAVRMTWDADKIVSGGEAKEEKERAAALKKLLGDGLNLWFGTDGKTFVQVTAADWDAAQKRLDGYFKGEKPVGDDKDFAAMRKRLPPEATVLMVMDLAQYPELLGGLMRTPFHVPDVEKGKPCYAGVAATLEPSRVSLDLSFQSGPALAVVWSILSGQ